MVQMVCQRFQKGRPGKAVKDEQMEDGSTGPNDKEKKRGELRQRKAEIESRLELVGGGKVKSGGGGKATATAPVYEGIWGEVCKEALWLGGDFVRERKEHIQSRRKLDKSLQAYFRNQGTKEERMAREQQQQLRRGAARLARDVKTFWHKINKVGNHPFSQ